MSKADTAEQSRLQELKSYQILDTPSEAGFAWLTFLAAGFKRRNINDAKNHSSRNFWSDVFLKLCVACPLNALASIDGLGHQMQQQIKLSSFPGTFMIWRWSEVRHCIAIWLTWCLLAAGSSFNANAATSPDHVNLQLKWHHQFQFAGYYAAQAKGFYADEGLDVKILEGGADSPPVETVLHGGAQFGVGDSDIVLAHMKGQPIVVLAAIFQHSPYVIMSRSDRNIRTPSDLVGAKVMLSSDQGAVQFQALMALEGIDPSRIKIVPHSWNLEDLIQGKVDAVSAYATVEPAQLRARGINPAIMSSTDYGVDFYGDTLFTTASEVAKHPNRVAAFLHASQKGWDYALNHADEIAGLILKMPGVVERGLTREKLLQEAKAMQPYILPDVVEIGHMNPGRWQHIAQTLVNLGMAPSSYSLTGFIYEPNSLRDSMMIRWFASLVLLGILLVGFVVLWNAQIRRRVRVRTEELQEEIAHRKQAEEALEQERDFLSTLLENISDGIVACNGQGVLSLFNRATREFHGLPEEPLSPDLWAEHYDLFLADGQTPMLTEQIPLFRAFQGEIIKNLEMVIAPKNLPRRVIVCSGQAILTASGQRSGAVVVLHDITERKQSELELGRLNRALRMLTSCSQLLIHAIDEKQLLSSICQLAVEIGGYRMAWVGYAQYDDYRSVAPMACAGNGTDYLDKIKLSWSEDKPEGRGPVGKTIRSGELAMSEDFAQDPTLSPWLARARKHGLSGVICLPLRDKGQTFGLLALYTAEVRLIRADEIELLQEMADDLAFGIINIRAKDEQQRIQSAVLKVAAGVSASTGAAFFQQLVLNMTEALGAQASFLAQLLPGEPLSARTIAAVVDGKVIDNMEYAIEGTPCENLISDEDYVVLDKVVEFFPHASTLTALGAQAYVGRRLLNSAGQPLGQLFVLFREALKRTDFITSTLQIFAARAAAELERQEADLHIRELASLLDEAKDAIIVRGLDHRIQFWNKGAERLYGWTAEEALGGLIEERLYLDAAESRAAFNLLLKQGEWSGEIRQLHKDGSTLIIEGHWTLVRDAAGQPRSMLAINTDINQRKVAERKIQHLAFNDQLTGLPNRQLLLDRLQQVLAASARSKQMGALLFIDLDDFKTLNDTLGHDIGDLLLQQVAHRLVSCVRESDTVARLGGDEFVVMLIELDETLQEAAAQAKIVGEKILASFNQSFQLAGHDHYATPSIGITLFNDQLTTEELLKRADLAMYQAKASGRNALRFFDPEMQSVIAARAALETDLREGLQLSEFLLHYQPQIGDDGHILGVEALVRWQSPQRGLVSPAEFIPIAEDTGLILLLGHWVLETACAQIAAWVAQPNTAGLSISVNVSARQFRQPDFVEQVLAVLDYTGAHPQQLKLELTESLLLDNIEDVIAKMTALKAKGVGFSLDDFGTGYSSLAYLKRLPLDELKIDQSFIRDVLTDVNDATIAHAIITLGQSMGMTVIAEGVETEAQRAFLNQHGCHAYQGYLFSRPLPIQQLEAFMQNWHKPDDRC